MSSPSQVIEFFKWTETQLIKLHPQLQLFVNKQNYTIKLSSSVQQMIVIPKAAIIASIPKLACFSHQTSSLKFLNCNFSSLISTLPLNHQPVIQLTIHLTHELSLQSTSTWYPYLNLIAQPEHTQPQLIHLQVNHIPEIQSWLQGTEIEQLLNNGLIISFSQLQNIHNSFNLAYPWSLFLKAFIIVSSRAFQIDNFHQLALVPIADLFDHSDQPDVEMISEDLVCDQCGASQECIHDSEDLQAQPSKSPPENNEDTVELVSIHPLVLPVINQLQSTHLDTEDEDIISTSPIVYNTYGKLSNARLLAEYGFMIDGNSYDRIHFDYHQVSNKHNFDQVQALLNTLVACNLFKNHTQDELIAPLSNEDNSAKLFIDSNARLSPHLWLAIIIKTYNLNNCIPSSEYITHLLQLQDFVSSHECLPSPSELEIFSATIKHLFRISQCIQQLCYNKLARYHLPDASVDELLTIKENLMDPESSEDTNTTGRKEREILGMAIEYACSERILLHTCCSLWNEIESSISS